MRAMVDLAYSTGACREPCVLLEPRLAYPRRGRLRMAATERHLRRRRHRDGPIEAPRPHPPATGAVISFSGVEKRYSATDVALDGISFDIFPGEFVFLVGHSGSGKSTAMKLLIKELEPTAGEIRVAGRDLHEDPAPPRAVLPAQPRRDLPGLQAAAEPHGLRERRVRAAGDGRRPPRDPRQGAGHPAPHRPQHQAAQLPRPALRRRAAARRDRARVRQPPAAADRGRADRQPRSRDLDRDHAAALPHQPDRHDGPGRHPRRGDGGQDAPPRDRALRRPDRPRRAGRRRTRPASPRASSPIRMRSAQG